MPIDLPHNTSAHSPNVTCNAPSPFTRPSIQITGHVVNVVMNSNLSLSSQATSMNETNSAFLLADARRRALRVTKFPGQLPTDISAAYDLQEAAIKIADVQIAGWKVAMIRPELRSALGAERFTGPILNGFVHESQVSEPVKATVYETGFSAVEAEFVFRIAQDLPENAEACTTDTVAAAVRSMHAGAEIVSSPIPTVNELGPIALISDFGGNAGCIVGPKISEWQNRVMMEMRTRTLVNDSLVGEGSAGNIPGGPLAALEFLARQLAGRGRKLRRGDIVLTGMTTGIHEVVPGDTTTIEFPGIATLNIALAGRSALSGR